MHTLLTTLSSAVVTLPRSAYHTLTRQTPWLSILLLALAANVPLATHANEQLPVIGNNSSRLVSLAQEKQLGQYWLRSLRSQVDLYHQPIVQEYFTHLVYSLAPASGVEDNDFNLVIINSPALNAFAVPGSVMGINAGLFLHAGNEQEFAAVIAHELAHLSQRHYARNLESRANSQPLQLASILASVIVGATAGSEAGLATYAGTQALSVERMLSFSRENEREADRLGVRILDDSNFDPRAMPSMFEKMLRQNRLQGRQIPEYLSTHPLSENRVADTRNRANQFPLKRYQDNPEFHLAKSLIIADYAENKEKALQYFAQFDNHQNSMAAIAARFGKAYLLSDHSPKEALELLTHVERALPAQLSVGTIHARALYYTGETRAAITALQEQHQRYPDHYPTAMELARIYLEEEQAERAVKILNELARNRSEDIKVWELLAESQGLAGNIASLHLARAEFFQLRGQFKQAKEQLKLALQKSRGASTLNARILARSKEIAAIERDAPF